MSFVVTAPPVLASAASDLGGIASMISEANAMAAVRTTALAPAAADEVSAAIAALFSSYARDYQTLSVQVTAFHVQFAQTLTNAGQLYAVVDVGNGVLLKTEQQVRRRQRRWRRHRWHRGLRRCRRFRRQRCRWRQWRQRWQRRLRRN